MVKIFSFLELEQIFSFSDGHYLTNFSIASLMQHAAGLEVRNSIPVIRHLTVGKNIKNQHATMWHFYTTWCYYTVNKKNSGLDYNPKKGSRLRIIINVLCIKSHVYRGRDQICRLFRLVCHEKPELMLRVRSNASLCVESSVANSGHGGGRFWWAVAGTFCSGKPQGTFAQKRKSCMSCGFYHLVQAEEGTANLRMKFLRFVSQDHPELLAFLTELVADRFDSRRPIADRTIGKYVATNIIGRGGYSIVYRRIHADLNMPVAIKMMRHDLVMNSDFLTNFRNEAKIIAGLNHENIIRVYDIEERFKTVFIIMEYLEGESLQEFLLRLKMISPKMAAHLLLQTCAGLEYAHRSSDIYALGITAYKMVTGKPIPALDGAVWTASMKRLFWP